MPATYTPGPPADPTDYIYYLQLMDQAYQFDKILVWQDMEDIPDFATYIDFYNTFYDDFISDAKLYGPNITVSATFAGGAVDVFDPDDEAFLNDFIEQANGFDGLAIAADIADDDWPALITYIREFTDDATPLGLGYGGPLLIRVKGTPTDPVPLYDALGPDDVVLWPSDRASTYIANQPTIGTSYWTFSGTLTINSEAVNLRVRNNLLSTPLRGGDVNISIYDGATLVAGPVEFPPSGNVVTLGTVGEVDTVKDLTYVITGRTNTLGAGILNATFTADTLIAVTVSGSTVIVG